MNARTLTRLFASVLAVSGRRRVHVFVSAVLSRRDLRRRATLTAIPCATYASVPVAHEGACVDAGADASSDAAAE